MMPLRRRCHATIAMPMLMPPRHDAADYAFDATTPCLSLRHYDAAHATSLVAAYAIHCRDVAPRR